MKMSAIFSIAAAAALLALPALAAEQIKIVERPTNETTVHIGASKADGPGDILSFANPLFDAGNKTQVGSDQGFCVRTVVGKSWQCNWTNQLKDGTIVVNGIFSDAGDSTLSVTGGTGKYAGAKGTMLLHTRAGKPESYDFTIDLS
jgi:allene oxide cyclase